MVKKLVILSSSRIEYVQSIARLVSNPKCKKGNFSKGLSQIIDDHSSRKKSPAACPCP